MCVCLSVSARVCVCVCVCVCNACMRVCMCVMCACVRVCVSVHYIVYVCTHVMQRMHTGGVVVCINNYCVISKCNC